MERARAFQWQGESDLRFLRDELYDGSWDVMLEDLNRRLRQKPSVPLICNNIRADIEAIAKLKERDRGG